MEQHANFGDEVTPIGLDLFNGIITGDVTCTLTTNTNTGGGGTGPTIGFHGRQDPISELETSMPLEAKAGQCVSREMTVRRLTPRECERLQGFPDDWTRWGIDEKGREYEIKDGPRYKMLGNAVATVSADWLGRQIAAAMKGLTCPR